MHRYKRVVGFITILIVFIFGLSQIVRAAVTYVVNVQTDVLNGGCTADDCSLREAIIAANANPGSDTIVLPGGIYALTRRGTGEDAANAGDLDITDSVTIVGESAALTIIDGTFPGNGGGYDRVFDVGPNSATISVHLSDLSIRNVNVTSYNGAGINNGVNASLTLDRVRLINNRSTLSGGGIYNLGSVTLNSSTVDMNYSFVTGSAFYNAANASMSINSSTIMNNTAGNGGAAIDNWGLMSLANSTVSGNNAPIWGGIVSRGTFTATNATIVNNSSGVYNINTTLFSLRNTIVALNNNNNCAGTLTSLDYNLIGQTNCSLTGTTTHNLIGVNPNLGTLTDNGGPTSTHALQAGSPAINAGDPANCPSTDQRGALRSVCDIGAYEAVNAPELFPPTVVSVASPLRTIDEGGQYSDGIAQLLVNFNEQLQDVSGDTDPNDVTNPANYQLIMAGSNGSLQTSVCGPLQGDDTAVAINSVSYNNISFQAALNLNGTAPLGNENYRLIVCSSGLKDTDGNQLDGNFDHIAGYDFDRNFRLQSVLETPQTSPFTVNITSDGNDGMCSTTNCTLRDAVIAANNYPGGGAVINILAGTYTLTLPGTDETFAATGDLDILASMTINGASRDATIIDGNALDRIYQVLNNAVVTISDVTIRNGQTRVGFSSTDWNGGGIFVSSGNLTLARSIVRDNRASNIPIGTSGSGGGIAVDGTTARITIIDSIVQANTAIGAGGLHVDNGGKATITASLIQGNQGGIGGIYVGSNAQTQTSVDITNSTIAGNIATSLGGGGGIYKNNGSALIVQYTTITQNTANRGGGIYCTDGAVINNSIIAGNNAAPTSNMTDIGGCSSVSRTNNIFAPEIALMGALQDNGGATPTYPLLPGSLAIGRSTGTCPTTDQRGQARSDGGCDIGAFETQSPPMVLSANLLNAGTPSIQIAFTEAMQDPAGVTNPANYRLFTDGINNNIESTTCDVPSGDDGTITINSVSYDTPTRISTLNLNGGVLLPVDHYRLLACPSLTDLSAQSLDGNRDGVSADPYIKEFYVDGAQSGPIFHVNQIEDVNDGSCGTLHCSLREAVIRANAYPGGGATIDIPSGTYTLAIYGFEDSAASGDLDINQSMTIYGAGADQTILDGGQIDRVFHFRSGSVTLAGVTIQHGMPPNSSNGGAMEIDAGPVTIRNSAIINNTAGDSGGGIAIYGGTMVDLINSTVSSNQSNGGDNPALFGRGGGIFNWGYLTVTNSTISGNSTNKWGGGILNFGSTLLNNATITNNTADSDNNGDASGGGFYNPSGTNLVGSFHLQNSIIAGNVDRSGQSPDCGGTASIISDDYNLIGNTTGCTTLNGATSHNILNQDAKLDPLGAYGGPTPTHRLQTGSPAINAGNPLTCTRADQRGIIRSACDMGAFEALSLAYSLVPPVIIDFQLVGTQPNIKQLQFVFSEAVQNQPGDSNPHDVTNTANYQLVGRGPDNVFQTSTCGATAGDDIHVAIDSIIYTAPLYTAVLNANGGVVLSPGWYRSIVCGGSGAILDLDGNALDGNGDYTPGDNFVQDFLIDTPQTGSTLSINTVDDVNNGICGLIQCSLREAVIAGNKYSGVETAIVNLPAGTYPLSIVGVGENFALNGDLDIRRSMTIQGQGATTTIIDGNGIDRAFHIIDGIVTVKDVTIRGGLPEANANGGGILNEKNLTLLNTIVQDNHTNGGKGGGIYSIYGLMLDHTVVLNNQAVDGGGIGNSLYLTLVDSAIQDNQASSAGGAIYSNGGNVDVARTTLSNNTASTGGGLVNAGSSTGNLRNTTISGNFAQSDGGGLVNQATNGVLLNNVTIANNTADSDNNGSGSGGGIFNTVANSNLRFKNTLLATNIDRGNDAPDCGGEALYSQDYNLIGSLAGCSILGSTTHSYASVDARINVLANNGGPTFTHALFPDSPAIDAGDVGSCEAIDQRGIARTQGFTCDIGAYERDLLPLEAPTGLAASAISSSEIQVTWVDNASTETGYVIEHSTDGSSWIQAGSVAANVTAFVDDELHCFTYYYYRVRAVRSQDGQYSPYTTGTYTRTATCAPPGPPINLTATLRLEAQVELSWLNPTGEDGLSTRIERSDNGISGWNQIGVVLGSPMPPPPVPPQTPPPGSTATPTGVPPPTSTPGATVIPTTTPPPVATSHSFIDTPGCNKVVYYRIRHFRPNDGQLSDFTAAVVISIPPCTLQTPPTFTVNVTADANDGVCTITHCSLREAVIAANSSTNATIILGAGTYVLSLPGQNEDNALNGDLDIRSNMTITGASRDTTFIDGGAIDRVFQVKNANGIVNFTLNNLTVQNGMVNDVGGGLYTSVNGVTTLNNVAFSNNRATRGGAIFNLPSRLNINDSLFTANHTLGSDSGGALFNYRSNSLNGGGVFIVRSTFTNNEAGRGGAIASDGLGSNGAESTIRIEDSAVINNRASSDGGGFYLNQSSDATVRNSTVSGNIAGNNGGAFASIGSGSDVQLLNSTIVNNRAQHGGGIYYSGNLPGPANSIFAYNAGGNCAGLYSSWVYAAGYNLADDTTCNLNHNMVSNPGNVEGVDPLVAGLSDNGGSTQTHMVLPGSPAIDFVQSPNCTLVADQRGVSRPQGTACDAGSVEVTGGLIAAPSNLVANNSGTGEVVLTWTDNSNNETGFRIERAPQEIGDWQQIGVVEENVTAFSDSNLICGRTYRYRVQAYQSAPYRVSVYSATANLMTAACPQADLNLAMVDSPDPVPVNSPITYTLTVTNNGPDNANSVVVTDQLPSIASVISVIPDQGNCNDVIAHTLTCNLGSLNNGSTVSVTIVISSPTVATLTNTADVSSALNDPIPDNNAALTTTTVIPIWLHVTNLAVSVSGLPQTAAVDTEVTVTLNVASSGPDDADTIVVDGSLSSRGDIRSLTPSQGTCSSLNQLTWSCNLGSLPANANASIALSIHFTSSGSYSFTSQVTSDGLDADVANNQVIQVGVVNLASPPNAAPQLNFFPTSTVELTWNLESQATGYEVWIDDNKDFKSLVFTSGVLSNSTDSVTTNLPTGTYYWQVRAIIGGKPGNWSPGQQFVVQEGS